MTGETLSTHEKKVLFALTEDATRTDAEIASRVDMRESTVGENRRKLLKNGRLEFINIPSFHKLGFEFVTDTHKFHNLTIHPEISRKAYKRFFLEHPGAFDVVLGDGTILITGVFKDITDFAKYIDDFEKFLHSNGAQGSDLDYSIFPFDSSRCNYQYNFAPCLNRILNLDFPDVQPKPMECNPREAVKLSKKEARVLTEIIASPMNTDADIALKFRRARTSITEMRNNFIKKGLYSRVVLPSFKSTIFQFMVYVYMKFSPPISFEEKISIGGEEWWRQSIYTMERDAEIIGSYPFRSKDEYVSLLREYIGPFREAGCLAQEPEIYIVSTDDAVDLLENSFAPIIGNMLL